ncbi:MAG: 50S ribosomal protein L17 [Flammeovirgaceae bacterium]|nr:50S ribosomal protein L17 [Flammeovirgaceae bacterium]MBR10213.1 50S ribosomal protein L17 [Rickettsiales bacterium]|tara:strand:+ start:208 stop:822 length:615 start_codon:yes stop_codon:yes gene_type:complete
MRHGKKFNHLGRTASHRNAMLSNMASSLILHKRINTTVAKAKALRKYVEPLITKAKDDTTHSRRIAFSYLQDKESVTELFGPIAEKVAARPGGYTRIIKTGIRLGDNAEMCMVELVDFNELLLQDSDASKAKTRRSRRGGKKKEETAEAAPKAEAAVEEAVVVEESAQEAAPEVEAEAAPAEEAAEEPKADDTTESEEDTKKGE